MSVDPKTEDEAWDRSLVDWLYEVRVGSILRSRAIAEDQVTGQRQRGISRMLAMSLQNCARSYLLLGQISEARAAFAESIGLCRRLGLVQVLAVAHDQLIGMSLDVDRAHVTRRLIDEALEDTALFSMVGEVVVSGVSLPSHQAQLAITEGRPDEALRLAVPLSVALQFSVPRFRARLSAIHLAARMLKGLSDGCDEIADVMKGCFAEPDEWLDWPALVLANFLVRRDVGEAQQFARNYIGSIRRELYPAPERLRAIAAGDGKELELLTTV